MNLPLLKLKSVQFVAPPLIFLLHAVGASIEISKSIKNNDEQMLGR